MCPSPASAPHLDFCGFHFNQLIEPESVVRFDDGDEHPPALRTRVFERGQRQSGFGVFRSEIPGLLDLRAQSCESRSVI